MDVLAGVLTGSAFGDAVAGPYDPTRRSGAGLLITIDIASMGEPSTFAARVEELVDRTQGGPLAAWADEILVPGQFEDQCRERLAADGIPSPLPPGRASPRSRRRPAPPFRPSPRQPAPARPLRRRSPVIALVVSLQVVPGRLEEFIAAIRENAERSFTDEPGCRFFDVCQDQADDHHFVFYELYADEAPSPRTGPHPTSRPGARPPTGAVPGSQVNTLAAQRFHHAEVAS